VKASKPCHREGRAYLPGFFALTGNHRALHAAFKYRWTATGGRHTVGFMNLRRKILTVAGAVFGTAILIPVIHHYQLRIAEASYIARLKAQGEPMELAQVIPTPVPPEQNSASNFLKAVALFEADKSLLSTNYISGMKMVAPGKATTRFQLANAEGGWATNSWEEVAAAVRQNSNAFDLLQQITEHPHLDFQIHYERGFGDGFDFKNQHLAELKRMAQRLGSATVSDLHDGDTSSAVENLRAMLALAKGTGEEHLVISELVQIAIVSIGVNVSWEVLQSPDLTDEQLARLEKDWAAFDFVQTGEDSLEMERAMGRMDLEKWRASNKAIQQLFNLGRQAAESMGSPDTETVLDKSKMAVKVFMWRHWWSYPDELRALKGDEVLLEMPRFAKTNHSFQTGIQRQIAGLDALGLTKLNDELSGLLNPNQMDMHTMLSQSVPSLSGISHKVMIAEAARQITVTAIALKRYQLKHGNYPPDLDSLVPEFVPDVPFDPVDGQPLRYRAKADGTFLLYSIGANGEDDNGNPSIERGVQLTSMYWQNEYALDWVWPQPATR
jgi:hypothetical protein